jgi:hypothetical protein
MEPVFVDPVLEATFNREILRPIREPSLYHPTLLPPERLHLLYGQKKSGMKQALGCLLQRNGIQFKELILNDDRPFVEEQFKELKKGPQEMMLVIHGTPKYYDRDFWHLKQLSFVFIVCISEDIPDEGDPFIQQFKSRILMGLPGVDFYLESLKYYFGKYVEWKKEPVVSLKDEDYQHLATVCCAYCTPSDVKKFCRRVFRTLLDVPKKEITRELLDSLMYQPFHDTVDAPCIINMNRSILQEKYKPTHHGRSVERKRPRSNESDV